MHQETKCQFWWPNMKKNVAEFMTRYLTYQQVKVEHQKQGRLLSQWGASECKWKEVTMDFTMGLPRTWKKHDAIWVVVDRLTKFVYFLPIRVKISLESLASYGERIKTGSTFHLQSYG